MSKKYKDTEICEFQVKYCKYKKFILHRKSFIKKT